MPAARSGTLSATTGGFMTKVLGISGSLRRGSYNSALLRAATGLMPEGATLEVASIRGIPLYDGDVETREGIPKSVQELKERIVGTDALLIATPEYNNSIPGVAKNAIDWLSRPNADIARVFGRRVVGLIGASPSARGSALAQIAWLPVLRVLGTRPFFGASLYVPNAAKSFDASGALVDAGDRERLRRYLEGFVEYVTQMRTIS
jgi:chromate reductase, NAD(P)H dehydrogenase (quinone)